MNKEYVLRNKLKQSLVTSVFIVILLLASFIGISTDLAYGATETVEVQHTISFNDIGAYNIWKHSDGTWQYGVKPGDFVSVTANIPVPSSVTTRLVGMRIDAVSVVFNPSVNAPNYKDFYVSSANILNWEYSTPIGQIQTAPTGRMIYSYNCNLTTKTSDNGKNIKELWQEPDVWTYFLYQ